MESSKILLDALVLSISVSYHLTHHSASDDLGNPAVLRSLLKDLREVRQAKIRAGLQSPGVIGGSYLNVTNLTPLELTELKPFLTKAMGMMQGLDPNSDSQ